MGVIRHRLLPLVALAVAAALGAAACQRDATNTPVDTGATTTTSGTPTGTVVPTTSTAPPVEFTTDGAGPYLIGKTQTELQATPGLTQVGPDNLCTGNTTAHGTGDWADVRLEFHADGKLFLLENRSINIPTPSGAWIGQTGLDDLKNIYKGVTTQELSHGTTKAFLVQTLGGSGILFVLDPGDKVATMYAADAFYLRNTFSAGTPFC